jgi:hypothetical protein
MTVDRSIADRLRQWDQLAVIALVVIVTELAGSWWLHAHHPDAIPPSATIDADLLDDDMRRLVRRAALENGMDPDQLPALEQLAAQVAQINSIHGKLDVDDRSAVRQALIDLVGDLATMSSQPAGGHGGPTGRGAPKAGGEPPPFPGADGGGDGATATTAGTRLAPSISRIDELRAMRVTELATARGLDPADLLPSDQTRQAAIASDDIGSDASKALQQAYRDIFTQLESTPATDPPIQP